MLNWCSHGLLHSLLLLRLSHLLGLLLNWLLLSRSSIHTLAKRIWHGIMRLLAVELSELRVHLVRIHHHRVHRWLHHRIHHGHISHLLHLLHSHGVHLLLI